MRTNLKIFLGQSLALAWMIVMILLSPIANQVGHVQIFSDWSEFPESLANIRFAIFFFDIFVALLGIIGFAIASLSLGLRALQLLGLSDTNGYARSFTAFLVGEIAFSVCWLAFISMYELNAWIVAISLIAGLISGMNLLPPVIRELSQQRLFDHSPRAERLLATLAGIVLLLPLFYSSTRLGYDAAAEYFSNAKIMAVTGKSIFFYPNDSFVVSSFHPGILFTGLIQIVGDQSARMLSWINGLAILGLAFSINKHIGLSRRTNLYFLILMVTSTAFVDLLGDGKVEIISTAPVVAAIYWMLLSVETPKKGIFVLIGVLTGFSIISRPYNIFLVSTFVTIFYAIRYKAQLLHLFKDKKAYQTISQVLPMFFPLIILGVFHLWQNQIWLGSPLAPITYAKELDTNDWQWQFDPETLFAFRLLYPFTVTFINSPQSLGTITPFFLACIPFIFTSGVRKQLRLSHQYKHLLQAAIPVLLIWVIFFFTVVEIRYVFFIWFIILLSFCSILDIIIDHSFPVVKTFINISMMIVLTFIGIRTTVISLVTYAPIDKTGQPICSDFVFCNFMTPINQTASPGDRVLALNAYRYYLRTDLFSCSTQTWEYPALQKLAMSDPAGFWTRVYQQGYRFVAVEKNFSQFHTRFGKIPNPESAPDWMKITTLVSTPEDREIVYRIETINPPFEPEVRCNQNPAKVWLLESTQ